MWLFLFQVATTTNQIGLLKAKYDKLVAVALKVQNLLDDLASQLERVHTFITWQVWCCYCP